MSEREQTISLTEHEVEILREAAGQSAPRPWGAAVGAALESLRSANLVDRAGFVTVSGKAALRIIDEGSG